MVIALNFVYLFDKARLQNCSKKCTDDVLMPKITLKTKSQNKVKFIKMISFKYKLSFNQTIFPLSHLLKLYKHRNIDLFERYQCVKSNVFIYS